MARVESPQFTMTAPPPYEAIPRDDPEVPEDFKIGVTVEQSSPSIRALFVRKVYTILFLQILGTAVVAAAMAAAGAQEWIYRKCVVADSSWSIWLPFVGTLVSLGGVYWKTHEHPANLIMLGAFTLFEALSIGMLVSVVSEAIVLKAFVITAFVFLGLTLYTLQSESNFESLGSWLYMSLLVLLGTGLVQFFFPSRLLDLAYSAGGCAVFSGYIVYDTWLIQRRCVLADRLSPDDWVLANVSLYLDVVNMFISVLRRALLLTVLNSSNDD